MSYKNIISVMDLAKNLNSSNWLILDCRNSLISFKDSYENFAKNHIPNARFCCVHDCFYSDSVSISNENAFSTHTLVLDELKQKNFNKESQLIIYDEIDNESINQLWLFLKSIGFEKVAVLQGGLKAWKEQKLPTKEIAPCERVI